MLAISQSSRSVVTLKNGTVIKGVIKSIDPAGDICITIAGVETKFKMEDVAKIDDFENETADEIVTLSDNDEDKIMVKDNNDYPEEFVLEIGDEKLKMILVRGGDMNMGYEGRHSLKMRSEPIHKVGVTSFYISEKFVPSAAVKAVMGKSSRKEFQVDNWKEATKTVDEIAKATGLPLRLPTEAEWEFAACSKVQGKIFGECGSNELCVDLFDKFSELDFIVDPTGPSTSKKGHVVRTFNHKYGRFSRGNTIFGEKYSYRIVIKAKDIKK